MSARSERLAVAIAGVGFMGRVHARAALVNGARLVGVSASSQQRAEQAATQLGAARAYRDNEQLIDDPEVQVVHICGPNHMHAELARAAILAGKHVICEKPLATDLADARELQSLAQRHSVVASVPYVYRYYPMVREARQRTLAGELGALAVIHGSYLQDWLLDAEQTNWRVDAGLGGRSRSFADIGSHWCDLVEFITGDHIEALSSQLKVVQPTRPTPSPGASTFEPRSPSPGVVAARPLVSVDTEDVAVVQFRTRTGALGSVVVSQVAAGHKNHLQVELLGTRGSLGFDHQYPDRISLSRGGVSSVLQRDPAQLSAAAARYSRLPAGHPEGYQDCVDWFVGDTYEAIRGGVADLTLPTFASGVRAAAITEAVLSSAAAGGSWVAVPTEVHAEGPGELATELAVQYPGTTDGAPS